MHYELHKAEKIQIFIENIEFYAIVQKVTTLEFSHTYVKGV